MGESADAQLHLYLSPRYVSSSYRPTCSASATAEAVAAVAGILYMCRLDMCPHTIDVHVRYVRDSEIFVLML